MNRYLLIAIAGAVGAVATNADDTHHDDAAAAPTVSVPIFPNDTCAIMGKKASKKLFVDTPKGRIYVCCVACNKKIRQDPDRAHAAAYPNVKNAGNTVCPVTGDKIPENPPTVILQGYEIALCCKDCIDGARENSQITLAKATNPKVRDVGNKICPITDKPVVPNAFCLVGDDLIRLSSPDCVDGVKEDPVAALKKAKELAAGQKEEPKAGEHGGHGHGEHDDREHGEHGDRGHGEHGDREHGHD